HSQPSSPWLGERRCTISHTARNAATGEDADVEQLPLRRRLVTARIWTLLTSLRLSAEVDYRRETGMAELDRRLLIAVYTSSTATPLALTAALGHDKGQVSRALKRLEAARLIRREGLRGPV